MAQILKILQLIGESYDASIGQIHCLDGNWAHFSDAGSTMASHVAVSVGRVSGQDARAACGTCWGGE